MIDKLLNRLESCRQVSGNSWKAKCPAHSDNTPSLSIKQADSGKILIHCFAGCGAIDVLNAINLKWSDLFPGDWKPANPSFREFDRAFVIIARDQLRRGKKLSELDMRKYRAALGRLYAK